MLQFNEAMARIDQVIEEQNLRIPSIERVELTVADIFEKHQNKLDQWLDGNKKIRGWVLGQVYKVLPGTDHKQVTEVLRRLRKEG